MSNKHEHAIRVKAAAYAAAAEVGFNEAIKLLEEAAASLKNEQWNDRR